MSATRARCGTRRRPRSVWQGSPISAPHVATDALARDRSKARCAASGSRRELRAQRLADAPAVRGLVVLRLEPAAGEPTAQRLGEIAKASALVARERALVLGDGEQAACLFDV